MDHLIEWCFRLLALVALPRPFWKAHKSLKFYEMPTEYVWFSPICISLCGSSSYCFLFSFFCKILEILCVVVAFCFLLLFCFLLFGFFLFWLFCFLGVWFFFSILIFSFLDIWIWKSFQSKLLLLLSKLLLFLFDKYNWWRKIWMFD